MMKWLRDAGLWGSEKRLCDLCVAQCGVREESSFFSARAVFCLFVQVYTDQWAARIEPYCFLEWPIGIRC